MHLTKIVGMSHDENGCFSSCRIELLPIFTDNKEADAALYVEFWHRLRRHRYFLNQKEGNPFNFDASLFINPSDLRKDSSTPLPVIVALNNAKTGYLTLDRTCGDKLCRQALAFMDRLVTELVMDGQHDEFLKTIDESYRQGAPEAKTILSSFLKFYCRGKGLFVDETDLRHALKQAKDRRRSRWQAAHPEHFSH